MFKIGDKIKAKRNTIAYEKYKDLILIVEKSCEPYDDKHVCYFDPLILKHNGWFVKFFQLAKKELNSEVDYLDAFQDNFKEGV